MTNEIALMKDLTPEQRRVFESQMQAVRKDPTTATLLAVFGLSRFYLGEVGLGVLQWLLTVIFIGFIWMFIDIFTASGRTHTYNQNAAFAVSSNLRLTFPSVASSPCCKCGAAMEADAKFCRSCGSQVNSAKPAPIFNQSETKKCPYCAELIQKDAKKCRYCGEFLTEDAKR